MTEPQTQTQTAPPCSLCQHFKSQKAQARKRGDLSRESDCIVLERRHRKQAHGGES